jgi:hypothetical protein
LKDPRAKDEGCVLIFNASRNCCPIKCTSFLSKRENNVLQWAFKHLATAEKWDLNGCMVKVNSPCTFAEVSEQ